MTSIAEMDRHIRSLCEANEISITFIGKDDEARAVYWLREIFIVRIRSALDYATALHEVGHVLGRHQTSAVVLVRERWAWEWARRHAIEWTPAMEAHAQRCMDYYRAAPYRRVPNELIVSED